MTLVSLPYRPNPGDPEDITQIMADFDAINAVVNGDIRADNLQAAFYQSLILQAVQSRNASGTLADGSAPIVMCNTSGGGFTIALPAAPSIGSSFTFIDANHSFTAFPLVISRNGKEIDHQAANIRLATSDATLTLEYDGVGWRTTGNAITYAGPILSNIPSPGGVGYASGAGGTVAQTTSKTTAVTLNTPTGQIATTADLLAAGASAVFVVNNTTCGPNDVPFATISRGTETVSAYIVQAIHTFNNGFRIRLTNISAGPLSESVNINFVVLRGALT